MNVIKGDYKKKVGYDIFEIAKHAGDMCIILFCVDDIIYFYMNLS